jgi:flagellar protein FlbD
VRHYRASLIAQASRIEGEPAGSALSEMVDERDAVVLPLHRKDR